MMPLTRRNNSALASAYLLLIPAMLASVLGGCDNSIVPITEGSDSVFALYGFLDTAADTQFVRVEGLRESAIGTDNSLEGVVVTSTDGAGTEHAWIRSGAGSSDRGGDQVFFSVFRAEPGQDYALRVEAPSGQATVARVTVPPVPNLLPTAPSGDAQSLIQTLELPELAQPPLRLTMLYKVKEPTAIDPVRVSVDYGSGGSATTSGWKVVVFLTRDRKTVMARLNRSQTDQDVELVSLTVRADLLSPEWGVEGKPDNITSGLGFFGAIGRFDLEWELPPDFVSVLGFVNAQ